MDATKTLSPKVYANGNGIEEYIIGHFTLTPTGLRIDGEPDYDEWYFFGEWLRFIEKSIQFAIGDWINYGEARWGEKYAQALDETEYSYQTLREYSYMAANINLFARANNVSYSHHREVASLKRPDGTPDGERQREYLELAASEGLTVAKLKQRIREDKRKSEAAPIIIEENQNILHGDCSLLYEALPDSSVDMFFTDPPYHEHKTDTFNQLGKLAQVKLKPGGLCIAYTGQMHLPQVMLALSEHLAYWWTFAIENIGGHLTIWNRQLWTSWRVALVFYKPFEDGKLPKASEWTLDFIQGGGRDKQYHEWGQDANEATYWIEKLSIPGALVCDPFVGGGAIPVACKLTGRNWIGTDKEKNAVMTTRKRLLEIEK